jgi:hypothetical protein
MITREDAEEIAAGWARHESERRGYECAPMVSEFDLGFVVWTKQPPEVLPIPGDGGRTVIDRATGALTTWPGVPVDAVTRLYRDHQPTVVAQRRTVDPEVELRRNVHRRPAPTTAAHLMVDGRMFLARGAKGDQEIHHHPLVVEHLRAVDPRSLVRGAERHAELIVLSDVLHETDRAREAAGTPPLTLDEARDLLRTSGFEVFSVRAEGDPLAGRPASLCESCIVTLVHFAVIPWAQMALAEEWPPVYDDRVAQPGRFPDDLARMMAEGGWRPLDELARETLADSKINRVVKVAGRRHRHLPFPAVRRMLTDFPILSVPRRGPGVRRQIRLLTIDPADGAHLADVLAELAAVIGARLFPIGREGWGDAVLAMDERGRVFGLDQGGEWFLGETFDEALVGLLTGDGPAERLRDDGTW